jgi:hypothetical protein
MRAREGEKIKKSLKKVNKEEMIELLEEWR